jgi:hypothetical protein
MHGRRLLALEGNQESLGHDVIGYALSSLALAAAALSTFRGLPPWRLLAAAAARPALVRSIIVSRSSCANALPTSQTVERIDGSSTTTTSLAGSRCGTRPTTLWRGPGISVYIPFEKAVMQEFSDSRMTHVQDCL